MSYQKNCIIGIRTHKWGDLEEIFYAQLRNYFSEDNIYVICDEVNSIIEIPAHIKKISFNKNTLKEDGLIYDKDFVNQRSIGWLCGDYFYYYLCKYADSQYYWLIEPDIHFIFDNPKNFFTPFEKTEADGVLYYYQPSEPNWGWHITGFIIDNIPHKMLFGISRLSKKAIELCFSERKKITAYYLENPAESYKYPNDEVLVATLLTKHKLDIVRIEDIFPNAFRNFSFKENFVYPLTKEDFFTDQIIHKLITQSDFSDKLFGTLEECINKSFSISEISRNYKLGFKGIESTANLLTNRIKNSINEKLILIAICHYLSEKQIELSHQGISANYWIFNDELAVLDIDKNGVSYVIEFGLQDAKLNAKIFSRTHNREIIHYIKTQNSEYRVQDERVILLNEEINSEVLEIKIKEATDFLLKIYKAYSA